MPPPMKSVLGILCAGLAFVAIMHVAQLLI